MPKAIDITIYYDYMCPWCYVAAVRLQQIKKEYGDRINIIWRGFPLATGDFKNVVTPDIINKSRPNVCAEENSISCKLWPDDVPIPSSCVSALAAARCARLQGEEAFESYHMALFKAYNEDCRDISDREVLISLARETGLDVERFARDLDSKEQEEKVLAEHEEISRDRGFSVLPTVVFDNLFPIESAVPVEVYRKMAERLLN